MTSPCYSKHHLEPLPRELLREPLDYILADHVRQRVLCVLCEQMAAAEYLDAAVAEDVVAYLKTDMIAHVIDEEEDLFPLIRRRAEEGDDIEDVLSRLSGEHATEQGLAQAIVQGLESALAQSEVGLGDALRSELRQFAQNERHHLAIENATVMPLARIRLSDSDLRGLAARMAARRSVFLKADDRS